MTVTSESSHLEDHQTTTNKHSLVCAYVPYYKAKWAAANESEVDWQLTKRDNNNSESQKGSIGNEVGHGLTKTKASRVREKCS